MPFKFSGPVGRPEAASRNSSANALEGAASSRMQCDFNLALKLTTRASNRGVVNFANFGSQAPLTGRYHCYPITSPGKALDAAANPTSERWHSLEAVGQRISAAGL